MNERAEFIARMTEQGWGETEVETIYDSSVITTCLRANLATVERERDRLRKAAVAQNHEIEQTLGAALGYPRFCDDPTNFPGATEADGVCVGDHVAETLATEAAALIARYRAALVEYSTYGRWQIRDHDGALRDWIGDGEGPEMALKALDAAADRTDYRFLYGELASAQLVERARLKTAIEALSQIAGDVDTIENNWCAHAAREALIAITNDEEDEA